MTHRPGDASQRPDPSRLLERSAEVALLDAAVAAAARGEGGLVVVEGPAGIGKTRLVADARRRAAAAGLRVHAARGGELGRDFPFGVVRQLFEGAVAGPDSAVLLGGAAGSARAVFAPPDEESGPTTDASFAALHGLYWLTVNLAAAGPLVLAVDDLHWCDPPSLRFLAYLAHRLEGLPVMVVASTRPSEPGADAALLAEIAGDPATRLVHPAPLSTGATADLIAARLGTAPEAAFTHACHRATGGNPLLLTELLRAAEGEGLRPDVEGAAAVGDVGPRAARAVLVRLARLSPAAAGLARAAAVLDEGGGLATAAELAGIDEERAAAATGELVRAEILRNELPLGFIHPLVREAVYRDQPPGDRERLHARAARILADGGAPAEQVAAHLLWVPCRGEGWVVDTLEAASRASMSRGAHETAVAALRRALEEPPAPERRPALLARLGTAEGLSNGPAAIAHLREACESVDDPVERARIARLLAPLLLFTDRGAESALVAAVARDGLADPWSDLGQALEAQRMSASHWDPRAVPFPDPDDLAARRDSAGPGPGGRALAAITAYQWAFLGATAADCVPLALRALSDGVLVGGDNAGVPYVAGWVLLAYAGREEALRAAEECLAEAHRSGSLFQAAGAYTFSGLTHWLRGDLEEAEGLLSAAVEQLERWGFGSVSIYASAYQAAVRADRGDLDGAWEAIGRLGLPDDLPSVTHTAFHLESLAHVAAAAGDWERALDAAGRAEANLAEQGIAMPWLHWRTRRAEALDRLGRTQEAVAASADAVARARRWGGAPTLGEALRVNGALLGDGGLPVLDEAVAVLAASPARLGLARALAEQGAALRRARRPSEAREPLRRALEIAAACGARPVADRARAELLATGARPRTHAIRGPGALTASERRVADLAATGRSNRDIAQELYVTPKTIELHLSSAYRKLGIRSRRELTGALG